MTETLIHTHSTSIQVNSYDPTRTTVLRNTFARDMRRRFGELATVIRKAIVEEDCFGMQAGFYQMTPPGRQAFVFPRSVDKVNAFMEWLNRQVERGILEVSEFQQIGTGIESAWTNKYIQDSYKRGVIRARYELQKAGFDVPTIGQTGGIEISLSTPFHLDRVGLLYSRTFSGLKGITAQMDTQISRVLAQGMADGDGPRLLARKLVSTINGSGMGELGLTDTLGRFVPAARRAETLARTEIIRAHHNATIQEYRNWGVEGVKVKAEWVTAGDDRVCDRCNALEREVFTLDRIEGMIPLHPNCRCIALPFKGKDVSRVVEEDVEVWKNISDAEKVKKALVNIHQINPITKEGVLTVEEIKKANAIGKELTENVYRKFIKLENVQNWEKVKNGDVLFEKAFGIGRNQKSYADYNVTTGKIRMATSAKLKAPVLTLGENVFNVGSDFGSVFRHEYGHHVWYKYLKSNDWGKWRTFYKDKGRAYFKKYISKYGASNTQEAFAECFSAYTSPLHGVKKSLPKEIIDLLDGFLK